MSVAKRLREYLDSRKVKYVVVTHSQAFTAQEIAASMHVPGREVAKAVVVKTPKGLALGVVRAMDRVDVERIAAEAVRMAYSDYAASASPIVGRITLAFVGSA